jgi:hypothetical protein
MRCDLAARDAHRDHATVRDGWYIRWPYEQVGSAVQTVTISPGHRYRGSPPDVDCVMLFDNWKPSIMREEWKP